MRVLIAQLTWHYDFEFLYERQEIPIFNELNLSSDLLELQANEIWIMVEDKSDAAPVYIKNRNRNHLSLVDSSLVTNTLQ